MRRNTDIYKKVRLLLLGFSVGIILSAIGIFAEFATWVIGAPSGLIAFIIFVIIGILSLRQAYNK